MKKYTILLLSICVYTIFLKSAEIPKEENTNSSPFIIPTARSTKRKKRTSHNTSINNSAQIHQNQINRQITKKRKTTQSIINNVLNLQPQTAIFNNTSSPTHNNENSYQPLLPQSALVPYQPNTINPIATAPHQIGNISQKIPAQKNINKKAPLISPHMKLEPTNSAADPDLENLFPTASTFLNQYDTRYQSAHFHLYPTSHSLWRGWQARQTIDDYYAAKADSPSNNVIITFDDHQEIFFVTDQNDYIYRVNFTEQTPDPYTAIGFNLFYYMNIYHKISRATKMGASLSTEQFALLQKSAEKLPLLKYKRRLLSFTISKDSFYIYNPTLYHQIGSNLSIARSYLFHTVRQLLEDTAGKIDWQKMKWLQIHQLLPRWINSINYSYSCTQSNFGLRAWLYDNMQLPLFPTSLFGDLSNSYNEYFIVHLLKNLNTLLVISSTNSAPIEQDGLLKIQQLAYSSFSSCQQPVAELTLDQLKTIAMKFVFLNNLPPYTSQTSTFILRSTIQFFLHNYSIFSNENTLPLTQLPIFLESFFPPLGPTNSGDVNNHYYTT